MSKATLTNQIYFDPNTNSLESDLRVLVSIRPITEDEKSIFLDSRGFLSNIDKSNFFSNSLMPRMIQRDEIKIIKDRPLGSRASFVKLPDNQTLILKNLEPGTEVEIFTWRTFNLPQSFTNRILIISQETGLLAFKSKK
jgi:hypothetical protein